MFTAKEILDEGVCQWCKKEKCPLRDKIADMTSCKNIEFDERKTEKHNAWNVARQKVSLVHVLCCDGPHGFSNEHFREWVRQTYQGKKVHV